MGSVAALQLKLLFGVGRKPQGSSEAMDGWGVAEFTNSPGGQARRGKARMDQGPGLARYLIQQRSSVCPAPRQARSSVRHDPDLTGGSSGSWAQSLCGILVDGVARTRRNSSSRSGEERAAESAKAACLLESTVARFHARGAAAAAAAAASLGRLGPAPTTMLPGNLGGDNGLALMCPRATGAE